jgi:competence protein ComEC
MFFGLLGQMYYFFSKLVVQTTAHTMKWHHYIMIRLALFLLLGVLIGFNFNIAHAVVNGVLLVGLLALILYYFLNRKQFKKPLAFSAITYLIFIVLGIFTVQTHQDINQKNHYLKLEETANQTIILHINQVLKPDKYHQKYIAQVSQINTNKARGNVLLLLQDSLKKLTVGAIIAIRGEFKEINKPKNPYTFDYANYLKNKQIYRQLFVNKYHYIKQLKNLKSLSASWRNTLIKRLENKGFSGNEFAVFKGLLLGDKSSISRAIRNDYSQAGAMHILAISGLHIGMLLYLLNFVFKPLEKIKRGKVVKTILIISLLWLYAVFTGLSPSVVRAVLMFSFVSVGMNYKRHTNILNTLFSALFILLVSNPFYVYEVGFQLSFIAVFGIVLIQPKLERLLTINNRFLNYFWQVSTVSLAAQISILPLSLYYFHQFPALFFLTNLVVIPMLTILLFFGIITLLLAAVNIVISPLIHVYNLLLLWTNQFTHWVASKEHFVFTHIDFDSVQLFISYLFILFFVRLLYLKNTKTVLQVLGVIILFQGYIVYKKKENTSAKEWLVFHKSRQSVLAEKRNNNLYIFSNDTTVFRATFLTHYKMKQAIDTLEVEPLKNWFLVNKQRLLLVDSLGVYQSSKQAAYILLSQSPKINLERLILWHQPKYIIADGSNYTSYVKQWQKTCIKKGIPFWDTHSLGAFRKND